MTVLRVYSTSLANAETSVLRVHKIALAAEVDAVPVLRVHKIALDGIPATVVSPIPGFSIGPGEERVITATTEDGTPADSWSWRIISGPGLSLSGSGASRTATGPNIWNQWQTQPTSGTPGVAVTQVGIKAVRDGIDSAELVVEVTTLPQSAWTRTTSTWKGARDAVA